MYRRHRSQDACTSSSSSSIETGHNVDGSGKCQIVAACLTGQVESRSRTKVVGDSEFDFVLGVGVEEGIPEDISSTKEPAPNVLPVCGSIVDGRFRIPPHRADICPTCFGNPHVFTTSCTFCSSQGSIQDATCIFNRVVDWILVEGKDIDRNKVDLVDNRRVGAVHPCTPGVNVRKRLFCEWCTSEAPASVPDKAHNSVCISSNSSIIAHSRC